MKPMDISRHAYCECLDQILKSNMSETVFPNRTLEKDVGREKRSMFISLGWGPGEECRLRENFLMPFKKH